MIPKVWLLAACTAGLVASGCPVSEVSTPVPIQTSIKGNEGYGKVTTPYEALVKFYAAFSTSSNDLMASCWDTSIAVSNLNQDGGIIRDRKDVLNRYTQIFTSPLKVTAEFYDYVIQEENDFALVVGREKGTFLSNGTTVDFVSRDTRLFRRDKDGEWRHIHHHGSFEDPAILKAFQEAAGIKDASSG